MIVNDYTALLSGLAWNAGLGEAPRGAPIFLTYSFAATPFDSPPGNASHFRPLNLNEQALYRQAIEAWGAVSGITFLEAGAGLGDLEVAGYSLSPSWVIGQAEYPWAGWFFEGGNRLLSGWELTGPGRLYLDEGGMNRNVMLHEIGHALGLKHPHEGEDVLHKHLDHSRNTVLSYVDGGAGGPGVLGELDIAAIQALYGHPEQRGLQVSSWAWDATRNQLTQVGWASDEVLTGTAAHDVIIGGGGNDLIIARGGDDVISVSGFAFQVDGGEGLDTLRLSFASSETPHIANNGHQYYLARPGGLYEDMKAFNIERMEFSDRTLALDVDGVAGQALRLYQAALGREPDAAGLGHNIAKMDEGMTHKQMAGAFIGSQEFQQRFAAEANEAFVQLLYAKILGREGEAAGVTHHVSLLENGYDRTDLLVGFSEGLENLNRTASLANEGIWFL